MEKLDRLGWADGIAFTAYGVRIGVRVNDPSVLPQVIDVLPYGWKPASTPVVDHLFSLIAGGSTSTSHVRRFNVLYAASTLVARTMDFQEVPPALEHKLEQVVAAFAPKRLFLHAGVVGWRGQAIVLPGPGHSGKSRLVAALVRRGATYYSDEYAVLDSEGRAHPFPRQIGLRDGANDMQVRVSVEGLGGRAGRKPLPVGMVALTHYKVGARLRLRTLSAGQAFMELMEHTFDLRRQPELAMQSLGTVLRAAKIIRGARGEAEDAADVLLRRLPSLTNSA